MRNILFILFAFMALPASAQRLLLVSGNAQIIPEHFPASKPLVVRAVDAAGRGVANVPIQWSGDGLGIADAVTDADGYARAAAFGIRLLQRESYVPVTFTATSTFGTVTFIETTVSTSTVTGTFVGHPLVSVIQPTGTLSAPPGSVIPRAFGIRVVAQAGLSPGSPIPNIGVAIIDPEFETDPVAHCQGPNNLAMTDANGEAYCDLVLGTTPATGFIRAIVGEDLITQVIPVTITAGPACTYAITPVSQSFGSAAASGTITVTAGAGCSWTASTAASWVTISSGGSGQGNGTVSYSLAANTGAARTATISIADKSFAITQAAAGGTSNPATITITSVSPIPGGIVGSPYTYQFGVSGGRAPFNWTATGTFPPGLALNPTTGAVTGTPTQAGTFSFNVIVTDASGATANVPFTGTISGAGTGTITITTTSLPNAQIGVAYNQSISTTGACSTGAGGPFGGGVGPVTWVVASGALPPGLTLGGSGVSTSLTGTPTQQGTYTFSVRATDACGRSDTKSYTVTFSTTVTTRPMVVTPAAVELNVQYTAATSPLQPLDITITGAGDQVDYEITTNTPWLNFSKTRGRTPDRVDVRAVNIGSFAPGLYSGSFTITSGATNSPITVLVNLRVAAPPNVSVSRESMLFQHTPAASISQQDLRVTSLVSGVRFSVRAETEAGGNWLAVSPSFTTETPATVSVLVNTTALPVGTYRGILRVIPDANAGGRVEIPVTAIVSPVTTLTVPQTQLTFSGPGTQTIALGTTTGSNLGFTAQTNGAPWLSIDPQSGTAPGNLTVGVTTVGLAPGRYEGAITVTPANGATASQIGVVLNVSTGQPVITGFTNAASFAPGGVAPGELVTLFGSNLGPTALLSGAADPSGAFPTTLANTRVFFDGVAAPLIYVAAGQISAVVPFGVQGRTATKVQVVTNGLNSNQYDLWVVDAAPGIFVLDTSGQGAILNQDGTVNARLNGADPGSVISIYATGAGQMDLPMTDGRPVIGEPYARPLLPVGVRIGGRVADVVYAGAAPGLIGGMLQVNARVPADVVRGQMVPIQLVVGTATSQSNVFLSTRP